MRMRKFLIVVLSALASSFQLYSINNRIPLELSSLSTTSVYSIIQDRLGAIWLNTSIGLCRFNGHKLETMHTSMPWHPLATNAENLIYAPTLKSLCRFDISTSSTEILRSDSLPLESSALLAEADSIFVAVDSRIYVGRSDTLTLSRRLPENYSITCLERLGDGSLVAGTTDSGLVLIESDSVRAVMPLPSRVMDLHLDSSRRLWIGLYSGGFLSVDTSSWQTLGSYTAHKGVPFRQVRSFASDSSGNLYIGAVNGLFRLNPSGELSEESLSGRTGSPVCGVFVDRDDNLWTGTYYNGVHYANVSSFPFENLPTPPGSDIVRSLVQDQRGDILMMTDNFGMWKYSSGTWTLMPGTEGIKYQGSYYDASADRLWAGDYSSPMLCYDFSRGSVTRVQVRIPQSMNASESIVSIEMLSDTLYLGGTYGLYSFNPRTESAVTRRIPGLESRIYDLEADGEGTLWIASQGLYRYRPGGVIESVPAPDDAPVPWNANIVSDISIDRKGRIWMALVGGTYGVVCMEGERATFYGTENCGLADNHTAYVVPVDDRYVLVGTVSGLSILDTEKHICHNYSHQSGLTFKSARGGAALLLSDGSILAGGGNGLAKLPSDFARPRQAPLNITLDAIFVNDKRLDAKVHLPFLDEIVLAPGQTSFSLDAAAFDYTGVNSPVYSYCLEGFDKQWHIFDIGSPLRFMNMHHGRYTLRVRADRRGGDCAEDSISLVLKPYWYATPFFKISVIAFLLTLIAFVLYTLWTRMVLAEKLRRQERENIEKSKFFVDISYRLRTPLNLIIGQIERFFRDFGSRTKGVENIEDIYIKAKNMRTLISDFVDMENDNLDRNVDPSSPTAIASMDAKFLNAAIGAVERNLFAQNLDVPLLCSELNMGKTTLTARLKAACGQTPQVFIEDIRLKHAATMLSEGTYRVAEVADNLGFSSPKYFSLRFKKKFGCNPSEYSRTSKKL
ncbi:MAG: helix-turn-helix domain-containing protein [Candidatus Cryptobacteroides sp.]|nr:helix-turn-helix domain-containing protein [Candidatus Cryptobacteroides sp.]